MMKRIRKAWRFVVNDVWDVDPGSMPLLPSLGIKTLRVIHLVARGFIDDDCSLHAASLTFNTLMAIVPILALSLGLIRGMGGDEYAKSKVRAAVKEWTHSMESTAIVRHMAPTAAPEPAVLSPTAVPTLSPEMLSGQINEKVEQLFEKIGNVNFAALGGIGLAILLYTVLMVFGSVEASFNRVWGVTTSRSMWRKFTDYLSLLFVLPILIVAATSLPVMDLVARILNQATTDAIRSSLATGMLKSVTVFAMTSLTFTFLIMFLPNIRVGLRSGISGGVVSGILFILWLKFCAALQYGVAGYGAIYGSFAVLPIMLAWVFVSWQIILFGAEVAYSVQNCSTYRMEQGAGRASMQSRIRLAISVLLEAGRAMTGQGGVFEAARFAREKKIPVRFLNDVVEELVRDGLLAELSEGKRGQYALMKSPESLRVADIIEACLSSGVRPETLGLASLHPRIEQVARSATGSIEQALKRMTVKDLLDADA